MEDRRIIKVFDSLKSDVPDIVSSFHSTAAKLSKLVDAETFAIVVKIRDQQMDNFSTYIRGCRFSCIWIQCG